MAKDIVGIASLEQGEALSLEPKGLKRLERGHHEE